MNGRKRKIQVKFYVTEEERKLIEEKMKLVPTNNMAAYLRKIAIDGYIIQVDHTDIKAMTAEIQKIGVNVNQIARNIINIFDFEKTIDYSKRLLELDNLSVEEMAYKLFNTETLGFYYLFDYEESQIKLENLLNQLLSCNYFFDGWREAVINLIDWLDMWNHTIDSHFSPNLFQSTYDSNYAIKDMYAENPQNPLNSVLLLKHYNEDQYSTVQGGSLRKSNYELAVKIVCIQDCYSYIIAQRIKEFLSYLDFWLEETGGEMILDPHYYLIK